MVYLSEGRVLSTYMVLLRHDHKLTNSLYKTIAAHYEPSHRRKDILENLNLVIQTYNQLIMSCPK